MCVVVHVFILPDGLLGVVPIGPFNDLKAAREHVKHMRESIGYGKGAVFACDCKAPQD